MNPVQNKPVVKSATKGFSLVELLVAMAVATILLTLIASVTSTTTKSSSTILDRLSTRSSEKAALDYLERDLDSIAAPEIGRTTLSIVGETLVGKPSGPAEIESFRISFLSRPTSHTHQGALNLVSYRMVFADPMTAGGTNHRLALYRTRLTSPPAGGAGTYLGVDDLFADFWDSYWPSYQGLSGGAVLLQDYLVEDVADVRMTLNYLDSFGVLGSVALPSNARINWTEQGFVDASATAPGTGLLPEPNQPVSFTFLVTSLKPEGAELYRSGALTLTEALDRFGVSLSRTIQVRASVR